MDEATEPRGGFEGSSWVVEGELTVKGVPQLEDWAEATDLRPKRERMVGRRKNCLRILVAGRYQVNGVEFRKGALQSSEEVVTPLRR